MLIFCLAQLNYNLHEASIIIFSLFFDNWYKCLDSVWHNRQLINMYLMIGFNIDKLPSVHILSMYILSIMYQNNTIAVSIIIYQTNIGLSLSWLYYVVKDGYSKRLKWLININVKGLWRRVLGHYGQIKEGNWATLGEEEHVKRGEGIHRMWCLH